MVRPAIFFDRDNTLIIGNEYLGRPEQVVLNRGAADAVRTARALGYAVVVASNQSGVARGLFSEEDVHAVNRRLDEMLRDASPDAVIDRHEFCPYHPEAAIARYRQESDLRKPRPGMLFRAAEAMQLDLAQSWMIGDAPRDVAAGKAAGCRAILLRDATLPASPAAEEATGVEPDFVAGGLSEAMEIVRRESRRGGAAGPVAPATTTSARLEALAEQILLEMKRRREQPEPDFSLPRLLASLVQTGNLAVLFLCYVNRNDASLVPLLLLAIALQGLVIALLLFAPRR